MEKTTIKFPDSIRSKSVYKVWRCFSWKTGSFWTILQHTFTALGLWEILRVFRESCGIFGNSSSLFFKIFSWINFYPMQFSKQPVSRFRILALAFLKILSISPLSQPSPSSTHEEYVNICGWVSRGKDFQVNEGVNQRHAFSRSDLHHMKEEMAKCPKLKLNSTSI